MKFVTSVAVAAVTACIFVAPVAHACGTGHLLYQDNFQSLDPAWNAPSNVTASGGVMDVKIEKNSALTLLSQANLYTQPGIEICATVKLVAGPGMSGDSAIAGLTFWRDSTNNYTIVEIAPTSGSASGWMHNDKGWQKRVDWRSVPNMNATVGGTNDLDVIIKAQRAQFSVNGKPAIYMIGTPPSAGWMAGLHLEAPAAEAAEWQVTSFEVREAQ